MGTCSVFAVQSTVGVVKANTGIGMLTVAADHSSEEEETSIAALQPSRLGEPSEGSKTAGACLR